VAELSPRDISRAILAFEEQFNEKLTSLYTPIKGEELALTRSQVKAMFVLYNRPGQTATELGEAMSMTKASLSGILDALEAAGLVLRSGDENDRRRALVSLTASGRTLCERKARELSSALEERFAPLSRAEREDFVRCLADATALLKRM
jgi:DNA-binding MarR family transcriptional regulator